MFLAALRNFELSDSSMDGCGEEQIGIPDFRELAPVLRRVGEYLAENELGERVSVEVAVDCLVQLDSPPNSALEESIGVLGSEGHLLRPWLHWIVAGSG